MSPPNGLPPDGSEYMPVSTTCPEEVNNKNCLCGNKTEEEKPAEEIPLTPSTKLNDDIPEENVTEMIVPPDGGWGWMVAAASFFCNMVVDGIIFSFGMFLTDIAEDFKVSKAQVALVGSLLSGFYLMAGPFVSALANRYGFRLVAISGSIIGALAFLASYFATSIEFLYFSFGVLGGIGFGLIYVPAVITVGFYFERWRALATGIAVCGSGIGTFVFAPISAILIEKFGWRGAILAQAALILTCIIFSLAFRPLKPTRITVDVEETKREVVIDHKKLASMLKIQTDEVDGQKFGSNGCVHDNQNTIHRLLGVNNNADYPTAAEVWTNNPDKVYHTITVPEPQHQRIQQIFTPTKRLSVPIIPDSHIPKNGAYLIQEKNNAIIISNRKQSVSRRTRTASESSQTRSRRNTLNEINRPMYRDDIFFGASLSRLPQYTSRTSVAYHMSVTRLPTQTDLKEEVDQSCALCPEAVRRTLATMLDWSLLKSPTFLILAASGAFTMLGFYVPFMYLTDRAKGDGMSHSNAMFLISAIGIANTIGRVVCGVISSFPGVNALLINNIALTIGGIATLFSGVSASDEYQFTYAAVFGLSISCFASLRSILVVDLLGLEKLTNAFGLLLLFQGVAAAIGAPMAGAFMDMTGSYDASFYLSGSMILASAIMCYPLAMVNRWELGKTSDKTSVAV